MRQKHLNEPRVNDIIKKILLDQFREILNKSDVDNFNVSVKLQITPYTVELIRNGIYDIYPDCIYEDLRSFFRSGESLRDYNCTPDPEFALMDKLDKLPDKDKTPLTILDTILEHLGIQQ